MATKIEIEEQVEILILAARQLIEVHGYSKDEVRKAIIEPLLEAIEIKHIYGDL